MSGVFISYRRSDTAGWAGRVADHLKSAFGDDRVFIDVSDIDPGDDFERAIDAMLDRVDAVVVMIGPEWASVEDDHGPRLARDGDHVRREVADALQSSVRVLPVLVDGASMPEADQLPEDLRPLTKKNAVSVSGTGFRSDLDQIVRILRRELPWYARPPRHLAIAGGLVVLVIVATIGLVAFLSGGDEQTDDDAVAASSDAGPNRSTTTNYASTTTPLASAITVTAELMGNTIGAEPAWIIPDDAFADAPTLGASADETEAYALENGGAAANPDGSGDVLAVQAIVQGTPRLADENIAVAITGFGVEVLEASAPVAGWIVVNSLPLTDEPPPIDARVALPASIDDVPRVDLEVDGEAVAALEPFSLGPTDNVFLTIEVDASRCTCVWQGELEVLIAGERHTYPILDENGGPFIVSGLANATYPPAVAPEG